MSTFALDFFSEFDDRWIEVNTLLTMANDFENESETKFNVLCRAAIVLTIANLEGFLSETIKIVIKDINRNGKFKDTSYSMKKTFCSQYIDINEKGNEKKINKLIETFNDLNVKYKNEPFLFENNKNPKASIIEKLFKEMVDGEEFFYYITSCDIEKVFENNIEFNNGLLKNMKNKLIEGVGDFPYSVDIQSVGFNENTTNKKITKNCLWKEFLNDSLRLRHQVAHGISSQNEQSVDEIRKIVEKIKILELSFAILICNMCIERSEE